MKTTSFVLLLLLLSLGCHAQNQPTVTPTGASLKDLRWQLNNLLSLQLPSSLPDSLNGTTFSKTFSTNFSRADSTLLEIPVLRRTLEKDSIIGGSKYYLHFQDIDLEKLRIETTPDEKCIAILIPAKPGKTFLHTPFGNEPEHQVETVTIGWYDQVQGTTLDRAYVLWKQFLMKLTDQ
ncbi:MAG: hypothetical protein IPM82_27760 [Saprospiraceae bacterium]|nr:hypothetical protein [Saprospiraceae bacterium]